MTTQSALNFFGFILQCNGENDILYVFHGIDTYFVCTIYLFINETGISEDDS